MDTSIVAMHIIGSLRRIADEPATSRSFTSEPASAHSSGTSFHFSKKDTVLTFPRHDPLEPQTSYFMAGSHSRPRLASNSQKTGQGTELAFADLETALAKWSSIRARWKQQDAEEAARRRKLVIDEEERRKRYDEEEAARRRKADDEELIRRQLIDEEKLLLRKKIDDDEALRRCWRRGDEMIRDIWKQRDVVETEKRRKEDAEELLRRQTYDAHMYYRRQQQDAEEMGKRRRSDEEQATSQRKYDKAEKARRHTVFNQYREVISRLKHERKLWVKDQSWLLAHSQHHSQQRIQTQSSKADRKSNSESGRRASFVFMSARRS